MNNPLLVQKYGGTSVGSVQRIEKVAERVLKTCADGHKVVVVVSAMAGETSRLVDLAAAIWPGRPTRETDVLLSTGEQVTIALLAMALTRQGCPARSFTGQQAGINTDQMPCQARIKQIDAQVLRDCLAEDVIPVVAGFQGLSPKGEVTTLGRGGSDTTAMAIAIALGAIECQIYTDVDGIYTADPRIVPNARLLSEITIEEMLELASLGSKVLHPRAVALASKHDTPLRVMSSFNDSPGTLVRKEGVAANPASAAENGVNSMEQLEVSGVTYTKDEAKLTIQRVPDTPGIASRILGPVSEHNIHVDMIVQNIAQDGTTDFTFTVKEDDYEATKSVLENSLKDIEGGGITGDSQVAKISLVGVGMRSHAGVATRMFKALADENINIQMITTSEIKISVLIDEKYMELAVRTLHQAFHLEKEPDSS